MALPLCSSNLKGYSSAYTRRMFSLLLIATFFCTVIPTAAYDCISSKRLTTSDGCGNQDVYAALIEKKMQMNLNVDETVINVSMDINIGGRLIKCNKLPGLSIKCETKTFQQPIKFDITEGDISITDSDDEPTHKTFPDSTPVFVEDGGKYYIAVSLHVSDSNSKIVLDLNNDGAKFVPAIPTAPTDLTSTILFWFGISVGGVLGGITLSCIISCCVCGRKTKRCVSNLCCCCSCFKSEPLSADIPVDDAESDASKTRTPKQTAKTADSPKVDKKTEVDKEEDKPSSKVYKKAKPTNKTPEVRKEVKPAVYEKIFVGEPANKKAEPAKADKKQQKKDEKSTQKSADDESEKTCKSDSITHEAQPQPKVTFGPKFPCSLTKAVPHNEMAKAGKSIEAESKKMKLADNPQENFGEGDEVIDMSYLISQYNHKEWAASEEPPIANPINTKLMKARFPNMISVWSMQSPKLHFCFFLLPKDMHLDYKKDIDGMRVEIQRMHDAEHKKQVRSKLSKALKHLDDIHAVSTKIQDWRNKKVDRLNPTIKYPWAIESLRMLVFWSNEEINDLEAMEPMSREIGERLSAWTHEIHCYNIWTEQSPCESLGLTEEEKDRLCELQLELVMRLKYMSSIRGRKSNGNKRD